MEKKQDSTIRPLSRSNIYPSKLYSYARGYLNVISNKFESLDYDIIENDLEVCSEYEGGYKYLVRKNIFKWLVFFFVGLFTATIASIVDMVISSMCNLKYLAIKDAMEGVTEGPYKQEAQLGVYVLSLWVMLNIIPFTIGSLLITYVEPIAGGSGIPLVKCYLNGVEIPRIFRVKTLIVKAVGLACSIVGGVASGKEGPMIHVGAAIASMITSGRLSCLDGEVQMYRHFRNDPECRDFISAGAASGVSAAFGASVGGVLFSLEEGASFWNQYLTWRIFFASVISKFTVNFILSAYYGHPGDLAHPSLINLGKLSNFKYEFYEVPIFALCGFLGGLFGATWNFLNYRLAILRVKYLRSKWMRVLEASIVSGFTAVVGYFMTYYIVQCDDYNLHRNSFAVRVLCDKEKGGEFNTIGSMWLQTPQASVKSLLHDPDSTYNVVTLMSFACIYYGLSCITFGLSSSNGIFVPTLLTGAALGRLFATLVQYAIPPSRRIMDQRKYALIGGAAMLGGVVRMTISLTVIIMETSDNISFSLPIIITLICAKWTGDFFNDGIYDLIIKLKAIPFLPPDPPPMSNAMFATEIMAEPVTCLKHVERVSFIIYTLERNSHNGFPIVDVDEDVPTDNTKDRYGKIRGLILRSQILTMLHNRLFLENFDNWQKTLGYNMLRDAYLQKLTLTDIKLSEYEMSTYSVDLTLLMNNSPYTLLPTASLPRIYRLFRSLGLRHLPIVNETNEVVGIITRKDIAKFRAVRRRGKVIFNQLYIV